jgi:hypothetical protein
LEKAYRDVISSAAEHGGSISPNTQLFAGDLQRSVFAMHAFGQFVINVDRWIFSESAGVFRVWDNGGGFSRLKRSLGNLRIAVTASRRSSPLWRRLNRESVIVPFWFL